MNYNYTPDLYAPLHPLLSDAELLLNPWSIIKLQLHPWFLYPPPTSELQLHPWSIYPPGAISDLQVHPWSLYPLRPH